jgi:hypothetical protein
MAGWRAFAEGPEGSTLATTGDACIITADLMVRNVTLAMA